MIKRIMSIAVLIGPLTVGLLASRAKPSPGTLFGGGTVTQVGVVVLEFIEPVGGPSTWRDFLENKGEGLHHLAFEVKGMGQRLAELRAKGVPLIQKGDYPGGRYAYVDATAQLGLILELLENY